MDILLFKRKLLALSRLAGQLSLHVNPKWFYHNLYRDRLKTLRAMLDELESMLE